MVTVLTSRSTNQTATFTETLTTTTLFDGSIRVHLTNGATATLTAYTPAASGSGAGVHGDGSKRNGASVNLPGNAMTAGSAATPFDGRWNYGTTYQVTLPLTCQAGDVVIIAKSTAEGVGLTTVTRASYWSVEGDSVVDEMFLIEFVDYAPSGAAPLRLFGLGSGSVSRMFRKSSQMHESDIDLSRLPRDIDLSTLGVSIPSYATMTALFDKFCGRVETGWGGRYSSPNLQDPGYGSHNCSAISQSLVMLCSDDDNATKLPLARALVQRGLDLWGAYIDGRVVRPNGGNIGGDKALCILAGHLLNIPALADPDETLGRDAFPDSNRAVLFDPAYVNPAGTYDATVPDCWWFESPRWPYSWQFTDAVADYQRFEPSTWTLHANLGNASQEFAINYMEQVVGSMVGTVLAMQLMGRRSQMGEGIMTIIQNWMDGPPAGALAQLSAVPGQVYLGNLTWGQEFSVGQGAGMCQAAWSSYWPL